MFGDYDGDEDGKNSSPSKTVSFLRGGGGGVFTTSVVSSKLAFDRHLVPRDKSEAFPTKRYDISPIYPNKSET